MTSKMEVKLEVKLEVNTEKSLQDMWGVFSLFFVDRKSEYEVITKIIGIVGSCGHSMTSKIKVNLEIFTYRMSYPRF